MDPTKRLAGIVILVAYVGYAAGCGGATTPPPNLVNVLEANGFQPDVDRSGPDYLVYVNSAAADPLAEFEVHDNGVVIIYVPDLSGLALVEQVLAGSYPEMFCQAVLGAVETIAAHGHGKATIVVNPSVAPPGYSVESQLTDAEGLTIAITPLH
jgi:hypothetical protein